MLNFRQAAARQREHSVAAGGRSGSAVPDQSFDIVVRQFGLMFFPDKEKAYRETLRVLKPGGCFLFSVWDRIDSNELSSIVHRAVAESYPDDPPMFFIGSPFSCGSGRTRRPAPPWP